LRAASSALLLAASSWGGRRWAVTSQRIISS